MNRRTFNKSLAAFFAAPLAFIGKPQPVGFIVEEVKFSGTLTNASIEDLASSLAEIYAKRLTEALDRVCVTGTGPGKVVSV